MRCLATTAAALIMLAGCDRQIPQNSTPQEVTDIRSSKAAVKPDYGPSAWSTSNVMDEFTGGLYHKATAYTTADSPKSATLNFIEHPNYPPQIHPSSWTHYCGSGLENYIGIQVLLDGKKPGLFRVPTASVHAGNEIVFIKGLTKETLDPVKELRIKLTDSVCGQVFIYYFDVSGTVPRP